MKPCDFWSHSVHFQGQRSSSSDMNRVETGARGVTICSLLSAYSLILTFGDRTGHLIFIISNRLRISACTSFYFWNGREMLMCCRSNRSGIYGISGYLSNAMQHRATAACVKNEMFKYLNFPSMDWLHFFRIYLHGGGKCFDTHLVQTKFYMTI